MRHILAVILAAVLVAPAGHAQGRPGGGTVASHADSPAKRITWDEFWMTMTPRHAIRMVLPDGSRIEGNLLQVKLDGMDVRITRTSNRQAHPKGNASIPRESVSVIEVRRQRVRGRLVGTLVPVGLGALILGSLFNSGGSDSAGGIIAGAVGIMAIGGAVGYVVGRAIDKSFDQLIIIPERQPAKATP